MIKALVELLVATASYTLSFAIIPGGSFLFGALFPAALFWAQLRVREVPGNPWFTAVDSFFVGAGINLLAQAVLAYFLIVEAVPALTLILGTAPAALLIGLIRTWFGSQRRAGSPRYLLLGSDAATLALSHAPAFQPILGIVARSPELVPRGVPFLGTFEDFDRIVEEYRPDNVILTMPIPVAPRKLIEMRWSGVRFHDASMLYESEFGRICADHIRPRMLFFQDSLFPFRPAMAIQSIYTNLIGLAALILLSPVLSFFGILSLMFSGPGPVFEQVKCLGFYSIPFSRLRFRTRDIESGKMTFLGRIVTALRLTDLPQLINVVRGELALIGPLPVREEHADRLTQLIPLYFRRFAIRPGLVGWNEVHGRSGGELKSEIDRLEYDLYYLKNTSPSFDLEIVLRLIFGGFAFPLKPVTRPPKGLA